MAQLLDPGVETLTCTQTKMPIEWARPRADGQAYFWESLFIGRSAEIGQRPLRSEQLKRALKASRSACRAEKPSRL
jgi:hypothetical protein